MYIVERTVTKYTGTQLTNIECGCLSRVKAINKAKDIVKNFKRDAGAVFSGECICVEVTVYRVVGEFVDNIYHTEDWLWKKSP